MHKLEGASAAISAGLSPDTALDGLTLSDILAQVQTLESQESGLRIYIDVLLGLAVFFCAVFAVAALASLRFVLMLRRGAHHTAQNTEMFADVEI